MRTWFCCVLAFTFMWGCGPSKTDSSTERGPNSSDSSSDSPDSPSADSGGAGQGQGGPTWYTDVKPIVESSCVSCHQEGGIGEFSLDGLDAVRASGASVIDAVEHRRMPPWKAVDGCSDYKDDISLSQAEIDTMVAWFEADMPEGDAAAAVSGTPMNLGGLDRVDLTLEMPEPYIPEGDEDDYRCFPVQWPLETAGYVTGYAVNPGRADLVHHVIAFVAPGSYAEALAEKEAEDGRPGYSCFGGPGVIDLAESEWLGAWAPGAAQGALPNGVGISIDPGSWIIIQVHYNLGAGATGEDVTSIDVQVDETVDTLGWIQPFANPAWLMSDTMSIPAQSEGVTHSFSHDMAIGVEFQTVNLHMHTLGQSAKMSVTRADGTEDCLLQIDDWDFDWQRTYVLQEPAQLNPGDTWNVECTYDNPTDEDVGWGDGTGDEMCLGAVLMNLQ